VVGIPLAIGFGLNVPHAAMGRQVNFTSGFCGPLVTTAAMPAVALASSAEGGGYSVLNVTTIAGGTYLGSPPQAVRREIVAMAMAVTIVAGRRFDRGSIIRGFDASSESEV